MAVPDSVLDEALERFGQKGPEFGPGLSNHGPMAAEALIALGRADAVLLWSEWYAARLADPPSARNLIAPGEWREALGEIGRAGDWSAFFAREVAERPWAAALELWVPRLAPGIMAGATHGVLRTAHAVRALERGETPQRLRELGDGLAYWAARYQELPAAPASGVAPAPVADALARVPSVPPGERRPGLIFEAVKAVAGVDFAPAIGYADTSGDPGAFVSEITRTFARLYLANAATASIAFVHTVTAPSALRILAPHLSEDSVRAAMRYAWQACAAVYATYGGGPVPPAPPPAPPDRDDLVERAVAARDEHAIKFAEACLREHALTPDPVFLAAAGDAVARLRRE